MNLTEAKKLQLGEKFQRPSLNKHCTDGFRHYEVVRRIDDARIEAKDEFGYYVWVTFDHWEMDGSKEFMKTAILD